MKKIIFILLLFFAFTANSLNAQNPIPSWNVPVYYRANFMETAKMNTSFTKNSRGKRVLHVDAQTGGVTPSACGTVWVYSTDSLSVIGPLQLCSGESLSVDIDDREWGVLVESDDHLVLDVWIE